MAPIMTAAFSAPATHPYFVQGCRPSHMAMTSIAQDVYAPMGRLHLQWQQQQLQCGYRSKVCTHRRALKRDGSLHRYCEDHRKRANDTQKRWASRRQYNGYDQGYLYPSHHQHQYQHQDQYQYQLPNVLAAGSDADAQALGAAAPPCSFQGLLSWPASENGDRPQCPPVKFEADALVGSMDHPQSESKLLSWTGESDLDGDELWKALGLDEPTDWAL